ncbi:hypothetical protein O0I10_007646 [Lichtheimia ornata]|uniref:18S rRNA factor 2 n=1 Tax=Lichtheimia ornata TaxID=688661 RepID=A0AAD7XTL8_9FUNG|nr:uncharacterized protein O0I10_007646 [Lichtheimia ornata]KAJ8656569.1 hypothetical protein O0I10_007646 [Lichtheimia ornata]
MAFDEETKPHDLLGLSEDESSVSDDSDQEQNERLPAHHLRKDKNVRSVLDTAGDNTDEDEDDSDSEQEERDISDSASISSRYDSEEEQEQQSSDSNTMNKPAGSRANKKNKLKKLTPEELEKFEKEQKRSGVCYLSRIPPFMTPQQVKKLLSHYAEVGRVFFETEDARTAARRKKYTRDRRTRFTEGWVEFKDKKRAKTLAEFLNMRQIGGRRQSPYYHDTWTIKYLPKFKWRHLTEQMAYERKAREQQLQAETAQVKRENKAYLDSVARAKMHKSMEEQKRKHGQDHQEAKKIRRTFTQREKKQREVTLDSKEMEKRAMDGIDSQVKNVLSNIFA